jgi:hypothetical protein
MTRLYKISALFPESIIEKYLYTFSPFPLPIQFLKVYKSVLTNNVFQPLTVTYSLLKEHNSY